MIKRPTMNTQQAAEYLGCSRSYIYRMLDDGRLVGYQIGATKGKRVYVDSLNSIKESRAL